MEQEYNEYCIEKVLIKGCVHYRDNQPVKGIIVILEKITYEYNEDIQEEQSQYIYLDHTVTNINGEFYFFISDRTSFYQIKVFNNNHR